MQPVVEENSMEDLGFTPCLSARNFPTMAADSRCFPMFYLNRRIGLK